MRLLFRKTLRDLQASWAQSAALAAIVALGIAALIALVGAYRNLSTSYERTYDRLRFADVELALRSAPEAAVAALEHRPEVAAATGRLIVDAGLVLRDGEQVRARLIGVPTGRRPAVNDLLVRDGRLLQAGDRAATVVESSFARKRGVDPGDRLIVILRGRRVPLRTVGVGASPEYLLVIPSRQELVPAARSFAVLFVPLRTMQALLDSPRRIDDVAVRLRPGADREAAVRALKRELSPYGLEDTTLRKDQLSNASLRADLDTYRALATLAPSLILLAAAVSLYLMLGRMVRAQQPLIGLMKALGYRDRRVSQHYLAFALTIGALGSVLGVAGGLLLARVLTGAYADKLGIPLVETRVHADLALLGVAVSLALAAAAGLAPSRATMCLAPAEAMRLDPATAGVRGHVSFVEHLLPLPLAVRLPLRNVLLARRRSFSTVVGMVFSLMLVLMVFGLFDSMQTMVRDGYERVERWDAAVSYGRPMPGRAVRELRALPGVRRVEPIAQLPARLGAGAQQKPISLTGLDPSQRLHGLRLTGTTSQRQALADGHVVIARALADRLGVQVGDAVTVTTAQGARRLRVGATTNELISQGAYVSRAEAGRLAGLAIPPVTGAYLQIDGERAAPLTAALYRTGATSVQLKSSTTEEIRSIFGLLYAFLGALLTFALGMAFALIFNAMIVGVLERERQLATMRAVGARPGRVTRLMLGENLTLWLIALAPGLLLGLWVTRGLASVMTSDLFSFHVTITARSYLVAAAGVLATMVLAALPAIHRVNRADLAQATKVLT